MPAKRNPKKKPRTPSPKPSLAELTPPDPAVLAVAPAVSPAGITPPAGATPSPAPRTGPAARGAAFANGKGRVGGAGRRYAFRRS